MINQDDVIYFMVTDRFFNGDPTNDPPSQADNPRHFHGGDFAGIVSRIPYLQNLGVTAIWMTPVYLNVTDFFDNAGYHGYWAIDFEVVDPHLYTSQQGRAEGSREYLEDLVDACRAADLKVILDIVVNHTGYHTPEYEVKHVEDTFWYFFKSCIKTRHPDITLIGEVLDFDPQAIGSYQQRHDFDTLFDFPLCGPMKGTMVWDEPMTRLAKPRLHPDEVRGTLDEDKPYTNVNRLVTFLDNHDLDRRVTTEILDRVGHWDRNLAARILKLCLSLQFTTRGIPQIYYGTEIGMEGQRLTSLDGNISDIEVVAGEATVQLPGKAAEIFSFGGSGTGRLPLG